MTVNDIDNILLELEKIVENKLDKYGAHGLFSHIKRVCNLCLYLAKYGKGVNLTVLKLAALLHDIARVEEDLDESGNIDHAVLGAQEAEKILRRYGFSTDIIEAVKHCIETHRYRSNRKPQTIEAKILSDADKLDVIGAVGIARSFMIAGKYGQQIFKDVSIKEYIKENIAENGRIKDIRKHAPNIEFELKLKKIPLKLYTKKAKEIARKRLKFMEKFFKELEEEIKFTENL